MDELRGRYSRGYLPHLEVGSLPQFLTWRLDDAVGPDARAAIEREIAQYPVNERARVKQSRLEAHADEGHGSCLLAKALNGRDVQQAILHGHPVRYRLDAWVVMPNHVHVLLTPAPNITLASIARRMKSYTALRINKREGREGRLWQHDYFDRMMRSDIQMARTIAYIEFNPVKAKLCSDPVLYPLSSANPDARKRLIEEP